jgi:hypothetical protein
MSAEFGISKFKFVSFGGGGCRREGGKLYDGWFWGAFMGYNTKWGGFSTFNRFGTRQDLFNRFTEIDANINLFGKLSLNPELSNFNWKNRQQTWVLRLRTSFQFTRKMGVRLFTERVYDVKEDEKSYNVNFLYDYAFTPDSHFYFVIVDSTNGNRAVFTKLAYLFESNLPFRILPR